MPPPVKSNRAEFGPPLLVALAAFLAFLARRRRPHWFAGGGWVPGWTGGIGLSALFGLFMVAEAALGNPGWLEPLFFAVSLGGRRRIPQPGPAAAGGRLVAVGGSSRASDNRPSASTFKPVPEAGRRRG